MLREEVYNWFRKLFVRGANEDVEKDMLPEGMYVNAQNMRVTSVEGNTGSAEAIFGEELLYDDPSPQGYRCIGTFYTTDHIGSFHAPLGAVGPVILKVNGDTVLSSEVIPYRWDRDLQIRVVDRKQGPVVFPVDGASDALFFDINRIVAAFNSGSQEFFQNLQLQTISVLPAGPLEWPEHILLPELGTGLAPGQYFYWLRYVYPSGDRSNFGPPTPAITVPGVVAPIYWPAVIDPNDPSAAFGNRQYPGQQTVGQAATIGEQIPTRYGITLKFVIDNLYGANKVEIIRLRFNDGAGLNGPGVTEIVASIDIEPNEYRPYEWTDPRDATIIGVIATDDTVREQISFTAPKAVEHVDNRVVYANIRRNDRTPLITFREVNGRKLFPITSKVATRQDNQQYNDGFADPVNNTYLKGAQHNETYGVGLMLWDGSATKSAVADAGNITMPARRDRKDGDSLRYSTDPVYAANTESQGLDPVSPTFDAIVQGTVGKAKGGQYINVHAGGPPGPSNPTGPLNYNPWTPKGPTDPNYVRSRIGPTRQRRISASPSDFQPDQGFVFSPEIHSLGAGMYGPSNLQQATPWAELISVMRTEPANAVIAEGISGYVLLGSEAFFSKRLNELDVFFPDMYDALVGQTIQDDIAANPSNYALKLTPFGFYTEEYGYFRTGSGDAAGMDMISYAMVQRDAGTVNVGDSAPQGFQPTASAPPTLRNNVGYSAWRGQPNPASVFQTSPQQGNHEFTINSFVRVAEGRGVRWRVRVSENVYHTATSTLFFQEASTRNFHEGMYVVSLIRKNAQPPNRNIQQYLHTGNHIALSRCIGVFDPAQPGDIVELEMFHARPYDAIPRALGVDIRYAYVQQQGQPERRWMHAASNTGGATVAQIVADINTNGFWVDPDGNQVYGLYGSAMDANSGSRPVWRLRFGIIPGAPPPATNARIVVKYDDREPILSHGFDCTVAPAVFAPIDRTFTGADSENGNLGTSLPSRVPLPYNGGIRNFDYILPRGSASGGLTLVVEPSEFGPRASIRQWVVMAYLVTRSPQHMLVAGDRGAFPFPRTHYVIRPGFISSAVSAAANGLNSQYDLDYPDEQLWFQYGGIRFWSGTNNDYLKQPLVSGLGIPSNGVLPQRELPCTYVASEKMDPLASDLPGIRSFFEDNLFSVSEENGEIKFIAALDQGKFQHLYGWNERGAHGIPYNKNILVGADGDTIGTQSVSNFWPREEYWLSRDAKGMPEEMWKLAIKAHAQVGDTTMDTVFWCDKQGAYQLIGAKAMDISRGKWNSQLLPQIAQTFTGATRASSLFNPKNGEWWLSMPRVPEPGETNLLRGEQMMFVFSTINREWVGRFTYDHDKYLSRDNELYGMRGLRTYELDKGFTIGQDTRGAWIETFFSPFTARQTELVAWRVHPDKPDEIRIYDSNRNLMLVLNEALQEAFEPGTGPFWVLKIDSWQQMMSCVSEAYAAQFGVERQPPQSTGFYLRVYFRQPQRQRITFSEVQAKQLP